MADRPDTAWPALLDRLQKRYAVLADDVRTYPTPIARCDEQLTQAIEERDAALRLLQVAEAVDRLRSTARGGAWLARVHELVRAAGAADRADATAACARFLAALDARSDACSDT